MADVTAVTGFKNKCAVALAAKYYYVTLHDSGGSALTTSTTTYSTGIAGELATQYGYTRGAKQVTASASTNYVDTADAVWTASGGSIGPAYYAALWCGDSTGDITGAQLVCVKDSSSSPQTATNGNTMTAGLVNPIAF